MKQYKNALRSRKLLKDALIDLLSTGIRFEDITITMLINKADVNRGTFYNHYNNIMDIANEIKDELLARLYESLEESLKTTRNVENLFEGITKFLKENESVYKKLAPIVPKQIYDGMKEQAIQELKTIHKCTTREELLKIQFLANCIAGTYIDYFEKRIDFSLDDLKNFSVRTIKMFMDKI